MAIAESILFEINSTNYTQFEPFTIYKPTIGRSGFITTLKLTVSIKSIAEANFPYIPDDTPPDVIQQILNEVALNTEFREVILYTKKGNGAWMRPVPIKIFNKEPFYDIPLIRMFSDANTIDVAEDISYGIKVKVGNVLAASDLITVWGSAVEEKKNDPTLEAFGDRLTALENLLQLFGPATPTAAGTNGLVKGAAAGQADYLLRGDRTWGNPNTFAKPADIDTAIFNLIGGAPGALSTLDKLAQAINDDANFATTVANTLALKAPISNPTFTGFVGLGGNVQVKIQLVSGTTPTGQGDITYTALGINTSKIVSFWVQVQFDADGRMPPGITRIAGYQYESYIDNNILALLMHPTNSANVINKPWTCLVLYVA